MCIRDSIHAIIPAIPVGAAAIILNIPLFLLGWKYLGGRLLATSLYAMAATSLSVDIVGAFFTFAPMDPTLAAVFGGVCVGMTIGIVLNQGATTGGTDLLARLLKLKFGYLPMGKLLLAVDLAVISIGALTFRRLDSALYGICLLYTSSVGGEPSIRILRWAWICQTPWHWCMMPFRLSLIHISSS